MRRSRLRGLAGAVLAVAACGCTSTTIGDARAVVTSWSVPSPASSSPGSGLPSVSTGFGPPAHPVSFRKVTGPATGTPCAGAAGRVPDIDHRMCFRLAPALLTLHHDIAVRPQRSEYGQWVVTLGLQGVDISAVAELTTSHVDETIAVVSDDVVLVAPTVQGPIRGAVQISGQLTQRTAYRIAHLLRP